MIFVTPGFKESTFFAWCFAALRVWKGPRLFVVPDLSVICMVNIGVLLGLARNALWLV